MIETIQRITIASYGMPVGGALLLDKEDAKALASEAPGGIITDNEGYTRRVQSVEVEEYTSESGAIVVVLEYVAALTV